MMPQREEEANRLSAAPSSGGLGRTQKPAIVQGPADYTRRPAGLASSDFPSAGPWLAF
jgi:hypothetical protein